MTDRVKGLFVTLDKDIRVDDVQHIVDAIKMMRHVADVQNEVVDFQDYYARSRVAYKVREKLYKLASEIGDMNLD